MRGSSFVYPNWYEPSQPDGQDHKSKRRRLFGRSAESASIKEKATSLKEIKESGSSRHSKESSRVTLNDGSSKLSAGDEAAPVRRHSKKKSGDDRGKGDRLSLFGGSIGGAIAKKARKPVPRLSRCVYFVEELPSMLTNVVS